MVRYFLFSACSELEYIVRDSQFYMGEFRNLCTKERMNELRWPERDYIIQIARFDPAKGTFPPLLPLSPMMTVQF